MAGSYVQFSPQTVFHFLCVLPLCMYVIKNQLCCRIDRIVLCNIAVNIYRYDCQLG